jgi:class 3 adenylate cyclase/TolB-like protein/Tfp pilus assembly protein PilF
MVKDSRKIAAILAADVVDYSRLMGADEEGTLAALKTRRTIFDGLVNEFGGHEFGSVGDSLMAEFPSVVNAVQCALAIQRQVEHANAPLPAARRMQLRIGVNLGDVIQESGSTFGDTVNVAARLQALAKPGGVLISGPVYDQVHLKVSARFIAAGTRQVKNIREPVRTFEVLPAEAPGLAGRITGIFARIASRRVRRAALAVVALVVAVALGLLGRELIPSNASHRLGGLLGSLEGKSGPNSIAVLPFENMSGDPHNDYLGEGLAEEISSRLTRIPELRVAARTSTFAFKGKDLGVGEIADRLGVGYVLQGSVKRQADRIRVTAALVDGASGSYRWSNTYEPPTADFFSIESDIAAQVIKALELVLSKPAEGPTSKPVPGSGVAYDFYLQGLAYLREPSSPKSIDAAEQLFGRALAEQPDFARAQAGLCEARVDRYYLEKVPGYVAAAEEACANAEALDSAAQEVHMAIGGLRLATGDAAQAEASYRRALALAPQSPDVLIGLADALAANGKADEADGTYRRAIAAQSSYAAAHVAYGSFLYTQGRSTEAIPVYERATILAPDDAIALSNLGGAYLMTGNFEKAADAFSRSLALEPRRASYSNIGTVKYYLGRYAEAAEMFRKAIGFAPADHRLWGNLADAQLFDSQPEEARKSYRRALDLADSELAVNQRDAQNQAIAAYYATRLDDPKRARRGIDAALSEGSGDVYVQYYVALAELGLGDPSTALNHAKRARELGYPEKLMRAAPELGDLRKKF